ncbi:MAG: ATP-dependent Clp protease ATP-binding subunit [Campylobacterota bacterium]|nr:ATP-dependent Clp protease ATP-binding subunit [Campylobacterota bacterium]
MIHKELQRVFNYAISYAKANKHEYITVDHIFLFLLKEKSIIVLLTQMDLDIDFVYTKIKEYINKNTPIYPEELKNEDPIETIFLTNIIEEMISHCHGSGKQNATIEDMFVYILKDEKAFSTIIMHQQGLERVDILDEISHPAQDEENDTQQDSEDEKSILLSNSVELVELAKDGNIDPVIGRDSEIDRAIEILARRKKNNPILLGETGVGKTTIVEGLALKIANNDIPEFLKDTQIYSLDMSSIVAGTKYRGDFEKKLKKIIKELSIKENVILFLDEIHTVVGAGSTSGSTMDASNILKPILTNGKIKFIGATTYEEYKNTIGTNKAFSRRFSKVDIKEPTIDNCISILDGIKERYESFHNVSYSKKSIEVAVKLSKRFITDKFLPDSAIDIIDEVGATKKLKNNKKKDIVIGELDVEEIISSVANIPLKTATNSDITLLKSLRKKLQKRVFGQDNAIDTIVQSIKVNRSGMGGVDKPIGCFLFTGSTGVGKTEVAKELASTMAIHFERFDMSEYSEAHTVSRLIGSPAGYVGYEKGGLLTESIKKHPHTVLLLDEIEKAHPDLMGLLLQIMDNATLTDNSGVKIDFQNVILIMTSNIGATQASVMGFQKDNNLNEDKAVNNYFTPEFRNRLDSIVKFEQLNEDILIQIVTKFIKDLENSLKDKNISISLTKKAKKELVRLGYDKLMGARPLQRVISQNIKLPLTDEVLFGKLSKGGKVKIDFIKNKFDFKYIND